MTRRFLSAVVDLPDLVVHGVTDLGRLDARTPTFALRLRTGGRAELLSDHLVSRGVACGSGHFYAKWFSEQLGLEGTGGYTRLGFYHYHTTEDVDRVADIVREAVEGGRQQ